MSGGRIGGCLVGGIDDGRQEELRISGERN